MALVERAPSEQESFSPLSRTESSMSDSSSEQDAGEAGFRREDDSDVWSSSNEDMYSLRETEFSGAVMMQGAGNAAQRITGNEGMTPTSGQISKQEILRQAHLRRHIDQLRERKLQADEEVAKQEESLGACRENLKSLHRQCAELQHRVAELERFNRRGDGEGGKRGEEGEEGEGKGVASCGFLKAQLRRVRGEIEREEKVEKDLVENLKVVQLELSAATMTYSDYHETEEVLRVRERQTRTAKNLQALQRLQTQTRMRVNTHRVKKSQERYAAKPQKKDPRANSKLVESSRRLEETSTREAVERARQTMRDGQAFLQKTLEQRRAKEQEETERERGESERRLTAVLSLKRNIENSEGTIQALQLLQEERNKKTRLREERLRTQAATQGHNPDEVMLRRKREREESRKRARFEEKRREKHLEIVARLLEEDKMKSRSEKMGEKAHWQGPHDATQQNGMRKREGERKAKLRGLNTKQTEDNNEGAHPAISSNDEAVLERGGGEVVESSSDEYDGDEREGERGEGEASGETLAQPEINGLWSLHSETAAQQSLKIEEQEEEEGEGEEVKDRGRKRRKKERSKLEQKMLTGVIDNLRQSIVKKQVAAGREFKGSPFTSKPEIVEFRDFSPGERLKLRLVLTNVTYTVNYCKLVGISPHLKDFISIDFNPPGAMSAGLTCHMTVTFEPKLNKDLTGEIEMLTQTGPFSIPVRCTTRKCIVRATGSEGDGGGEEDSVEVDFGRVCVGETVRRSILLHNDGALPTEFSITPSTCSEPKSSEREVNESVAESVSGASSSQSSLPSVMSEVRGDWGAVARLKSSHRPVSRSTGQLPQFVFAQQQADHSATPEDNETESSNTDKSRPGQRSGGPSKPATPVKLDQKLTKLNQRLVEQDHKSTSQDQKPTIPVKQEATEDKLDSSPEKLHTSGHTQSREEEISAEEKEKKTPVESSTREENISPAIVIEKNQAGYLDGYSSCRVDLAYSPTTASPSSQIFTISFTQTGVKPITVKARGEGLDLPIFVTRETIDLRICTTNRLYQDSVQVTNRGNTALRVAFQLPPELAPHLEISPPHGLVQGASSFSARLKFLPLPGIFAECDKYFEDDCLKVPAEIRVVDQVLPVPYSIHARVTTSDLVFSSSDIDFRTCTLHESVVATLSITNTSILPQEFGFVHLPDCVDVQPNDGFGTILPQETISLDLVFSANKPRDYSFELTCLTRLNRSFKISCKGRGVLPSLKLSENVVNFAATPLDSLTTARISITNPRLSRLSSAVIRGAVLPQGPKVFEFSVPDGVPMEISPRVGTIDLDESVSIELSYTPSLPVTTIREEAVRLATEAARIRTREEALAAQHKDLASTSTPEQKKGASHAESQKKKRKGKGEASSSGRESEASGRKSGGGGGGSFKTEGERSSQIQQGKTEGARSDKDDCSGEEGVKVDAPEEGSEMWQQAMANLLNGFQNWTHQFSVPCFVSSAAPTSELDTVPYRPEDTLYVEVRVPVVKQSLLILSNGGNSTLDFGSVATGDYLTKHLTVKNISDTYIQLVSSPLDPRGPFDLRNALRSVPPSSTHTLSLRFSPSHGGRFYEVMRLSYSGSGGTDLRLIGEAVEPRVVLEPDTDRMDFGHTYTGDTSVRKFQLKNTCSLGVRYNIELLGRKDVKGAKFRAANYSGKPVFDCIPFQGRIEPESVAEFQVIFSPDHQSAHYSDILTININDTPTHTLKLAGQACSSIMYITGSDNQTKAEFHSMAAGMPSLGPDGEPVEPVEPVLVLFDERAGEGGGGVVKRELEIGCIKSATVKKNAGDFTIEAIPPSNPHSKTFTFDPTKGTVEAGSTKTVAISFHPPQSAVKDGIIIQANTNIILKGDVTRTCKLLLRAITAH